MLKGKKARSKGRTNGTINRPSRANSGDTEPVLFTAEQEELRDKACASLLG